MSRWFRISMAKGGRESAWSSHGGPKLTIILRRRKGHLRRCSPKLAGRNFDLRAKSSWEDFVNIYKKILSGGFSFRIKIVAERFCETPKKVTFFSQNKGQLWPLVTPPCRLSTPLCHTYSEPSGHEDSPGGTQNIPYLFKNLSKSRLSDPFFVLFLVISEVISHPLVF